MQKPKTIDYDTALKARALFVMGANHYRQASEYEAALSSLLGFEDARYCEQLSDAMVDGDKGFDAALKNAGFVVAESKKS